MPEDDAADIEFEVEAIINSRKYVRNRMKYQVKWLGYPSSANSWESAKDLSNASELIEQFHKAYPHKSAPNEIQKRREAIKVKENRERKEALTAKP